MITVFLRKGLGAMKSYDCFFPPCCVMFEPVDQLGQLCSRQPQRISKVHLVVREKNLNRIFNIAAESFANQFHALLEESLLISC